MPVAGSSLTVARVMRTLQRALAAIGTRRTSDATVRSRAETLLAQAADVPVALLMAGKYALCRKDDRQIRADFRAWANILPGVHVSALATPALVRSLKAPRRRAAG